MIDVRNVHKSYRSGSRWVEALRGVSCEIERGRFAFIVGPSGSGKSTLLYLIGALDRPTSGEIIVEGQNLATMSEAEQNAYRRDQIGFIFQSFNLISNLTALENVLVPFLPRGVTAEQRQRAIDVAQGCRPGGSHRSPAVPALRRRTAAGGDRPGAGQAAGADPRRRADRRAGFQGRRRDLPILRRLQESSGTTLVIVTHDRRFITSDDLVLEIQDGQLANGHEAEAVDYSAVLSPG